MHSEIRVIGLDHGIHHTGYGILLKKQTKITCLDWGTIDTSPKLAFPKRLQKIYEELLEIIGRWNPTIMAIETAIYAQNIKTALLMGHARACAILAGANSELEIFEYSPKKIKSAVVGNGAAAKEQVRFMITRLLNIPDQKITFDASDALAAGFCHLNQMPRQVGLR
jgi:crossover junction endodeoxyribonuclease RuvC